MSNPYILVAILLALIGAFGYGAKTGADREIARQARTEALIAQVADAAQKSAAQAIASIEIKQTTIRQRTEVEIRNHEIYRDCRVDDVTRGLLDAARSGGPVPEPVGDRVLPGAGTGTP